MKGISINRNMVKTGLAFAKELQSMTSMCVLTGIDSLNFDLSSLIEGTKWPIPGAVRNRLVARCVAIRPDFRSCVVECHPTFGMLQLAIGGDGCTVGYCLAIPSP